MPEIITKNRSKQNVIFVLYDRVCDGCPTGKLIHRFNEKEDILCVVPSDYSDVDIIKFKDAFMTSGEVIKGNEDVENYLEKIAACKKTRGWKNNVFIEVKENGDVIKIKII